jgi:antirestriction protein ArdC
MANAIKRDLYAEVTSRILAELERGAAPWVKPWSATPGQNVPQNAVSNRPYSGCNVVLLWLTRGNGWPTPRFVTFKQAQKARGPDPSKAIAASAITLTWHAGAQIPPH